MSFVVSMDFSFGVSVTQKTRKLYLKMFFKILNADRRTSFNVYETGPGKTCKITEDVVKTLLQRPHKRIVKTKPPW